MKQEKNGGNDKKAIAEREERQSGFRGEGWRGARIALCIAAILFAISMIATITVNACSPGLEIGTSIVRDINILLISTSATLLGLYITAFIFLNDSLKSRVKEDQTIKEAVDIILLRYRNNMIWIAFGTIAAIILEVVCNIALGGPQGDLSIENTRLLLTDIKWYLFVFVTVFSIFIIAWVIWASKDITNSDDLIARQSFSNLERHRNHLLECYQEIAKNSEKLSSGSATDFSTMTGNEILQDFGRGTNKYTFEHAYRSIKDKINGKKDAAQGDELFPEIETEQEYIIQLGKVVRLIELIIGRVCDNNIDKSIMNNELLFQSMRSGFLWLYGRETRDAVLDVRDVNRFLDHLKYQIITDKRFQKKPFENSEVEEAFGRAKEAFERLDHNVNPKSQDSDAGYKINFIKDYKTNIRKIIKEFFDDYKHLIGYRDALVHFDRYKRTKKRRRRDVAANEREKEEWDEREKEEWDEREKEADKKILAYAELLKRVLLDRFTSFVKVNDLNLGNSTLDKSWFNYSELSDSNFTHTSFKFARMENAIFRNCDLSTCSFVLADASNTDFQDSNFSYSNLTGLDLTEAVLNRAQMNSVLLRDERLDHYKGGELLINAARVELLSKEETIDKCRKDLDKLTSFKASDSVCSEQKLKQERAERRSGKAISDLALDLSGEKEGEWLGSYMSVRKQDALPSFFLAASKGSECCGLMEDSYNKIMKEVIRPLIEFRKGNKISDDLLKIYSEGREREKPDDKEMREHWRGKVYFGVAILRSASVNEVSMKNVDFSHVEIDKASFVDSDLSETDMYYTSARKTKFFRTNLNGLDAYRASFTGSNFTEANMVDAVFTDCALTGCNFEKAILLNCMIVNSQEELPEAQRRPYMSRFIRRRKEGHDPLQALLEYVEEEEEIDGKFFHIANLDEKYACTDCEFSNVIGDRMSILNVNMMRSKFNGASAQNAFLYNVLLRWCDLIGADFSNCLCYGVSFHQSGLAGAKFARAKFFACEFSNADLSGANLISGKIEKAIFDEANLSRCNVSSAYIRNSSFNKCNFDGIILTDAVFENVVFSKIDFSGAIGLDEAHFKNCIFEQSEQDGPITGEEFIIGESVAEEKVILSRSDSGDVKEIPRYSDAASLTQ